MLAKGSTPYWVLWAGVAVAFVRWLPALADTFDAVRPAFWPDETERLPVIMRP